MRNTSTRILAVTGLIVGLTATIAGTGATTALAAASSTVLSSTAEVEASARAATPVQDLTDSEGHEAQPFTDNHDETVPAHEGPFTDPASGESATSDAAADFSTGITTANDGQLLTISSQGDTTDADSASTDGNTVAGSEAR